MHDICTYALRGNLENVKLLLQRGVDVNGKAELFQRTALHLAASKGHVEIVEVLLEAEADIYARDDDGYTALHLAAHAAAKFDADNVNKLEKYYQIFRLILKKEAQLRISGQPIEVLLKDSTGNSGGTPADFMKRNKQAQEKFLEIVRDIEVNCPAIEQRETSSYSASTKKDSGIRQRVPTAVTVGEAIGTCTRAGAEVGASAGTSAGIMLGRAIVSAVSDFWDRKGKDKNEKKPLLQQNDQDTFEIRKKPHFS